MLLLSCSCAACLACSYAAWLACSGAAWLVCSYAAVGLLFYTYSLFSARGAPSGLVAPKHIRQPAPIAHKLGPLEPLRDILEEACAKRAWLCVQRRLEGANARLLEAAQRILGGMHQMNGGVMEEGTAIPEWDDIKFRWTGARINAPHPKSDYHQWVILQPFFPVLLCQQMVITDRSYRHLARQVEEHWDLKLVDGMTGLGRFLPVCLGCMGRWSSYDESHELALLEWQ